MTTDAIEYVKKNINKVVVHYEKGDNPEVWVKKELGLPAFQEVPDLDFEDFELLVDVEKPASTDIYNIKLLYTYLKELNDSFASDERLWAGLTHTIFYEYMQKRWKGKTSPKSIINHYFLGGTRTFMVNSIARLWWLGRKTYSEVDENNFKMLDYMANDINGYAFTLFGSNWANSEKILGIFFEAIYEYTDETSAKVDRLLFNEAIQYTNGLCGIFLLEACDDDFIKEKIKKYLYQRAEEIKIENEQNKVNNVKKTGTERLDTVIKAVNYLGGHGTRKQIFNAYEIMNEKKISVSDRNYITKVLKEQKTMFEKTKTDDFDGYRVTVSFLTVPNRKQRKTFVERNIDKLDGMNSKTFNIVTSIKKNTFSLNEILAYEQHLKRIMSENTDINSELKKGINVLVEYAILEKREKNIYKKVYEFT